MERVEWVDDTCANLVFSSEPNARDALVALTTVEVADASALSVGESLPAKPVEGRPEISLQVRFAVASDRKQVGAALRSRYYLLHPEHDPEERRRRQQDSRSRYRDRDGDYRRDSGRRRRKSDDDVETYEASMYDDAPRDSADRRNSDSYERPRSYAKENQGKELFGGGGRRSARDRSASPARDDDGDDLMGERASSARNRTQARSIKDRISADNKSRELFPTKSSGRGGARLDELERRIGSARLKEEDRPRIVAVSDAPASSSFNIKGMANQGGDEGGFSIKGAASGASARELFPDRFGGTNAGKELFDGNRTKKRQKAEDLFS